MRYRIRHLPELDVLIFPISVSSIPYFNKGNPFQQGIMGQQFFGMDSSCFCPMHWMGSKDRYVLNVGIDQGVVSSLFA